VNSRFDEHFHCDTPFDMGSENEVGFGQNGGVDQKLVAAVCQEMMKMFKWKGIMEDKNYAGTSHAAVTKPNKDKFDNRGVKCVLLGYPQNQKGYKLYDLNTKEIFLSRDVVFDETVFPFKGDTFTHPNITPSLPTFGDIFLDEENGVVPNTSLFQSATTQEPIIQTPPVPNIPEPISYNPPDSNIPTQLPNTTNPISNNERIQTKRSSRQSAKPSWLKIFVTPQSHRANATSRYNQAAKGQVLQVEQTLYGLKQASLEIMPYQASKSNQTRNKKIVAANTSTQTATKQAMATNKEPSTRKQTSPSLFRQEGSSNHIAAAPLTKSYQGKQQLIMKMNSYHGQILKRACVRSTYERWMRNADPTRSIHADVEPRVFGQSESFQVSVTSGDLMLLFTNGLLSSSIITLFAASILKIMQAVNMQSNKWNFVECNQQRYYWECGYYVMKWMHQFVTHRQHSFPKTVPWNDKKPFTTKELDDIMSSCISVCRI
ncbi:ulp1 protease family, C-terminal catalytic domain-containing protein, partial [Tanacetum coccineum]